MRALVTPFIICGALSVTAQMPPITLEWSAIRPYEGSTGATQIARDAISGEYIWAVNDPDFAENDEHGYPFLSDGTDVTPTYPQTFNVGSLDHLVEVELQNGVTYDLMRHQLIGGIQPYNWHVRGYGPGGNWDVWLQSTIDPDYSEMGSDMLVTNTAVYSCGVSGTGLNSAIPRVLKIDLQGNVIWNETWDPGATSPITQFSSMAVAGDTVVCSWSSEMVLFNATTGAYIATVDPYAGAPVAACCASLLAHGGRVYWTSASADILYAGWFDLGNATSDSWSLALPGAQGGQLVIDDYDHIWIACTAANTGRWFRLGLDLVPIDNGTFYGGIDDISFAAGKISFTGPIDATGTTAILVTGTPQP